MSSSANAVPIAEFLHRRLVASYPAGGQAGDADVAALLEALRNEFAEQICAVLLYGSYLRGTKDTLLDFYVVVEDYEQAFGSKWRALSAFLMPPNVYYLSVADGERQVRAKYAVVSRRQLQRQVGSVHPYFWARFTQPCNLVYARDRDAVNQLASILCGAVNTFMRRVAPVMDGPFAPAEFWNQGFALTYRAELRAEKQARVASIFDHDADFYTALLDLCVDGQFLQVHSDAETQPAYSVHAPGAARWARWYWRWTIALGKLLSIARLIKGAITFNDPIDYMLWKIERHSGIRVEASERQRRYPLIFAWPLAWRLFRLGAFR